MGHVAPSVGDGVHQPLLSPRGHRAVPSSVRPRISLLAGTRVSGWYLPAIRRRMISAICRYMGPTRSGFGSNVECGATYLGTTLHVPRRACTDWVSCKGVRQGRSVAQCGYPFPAGLPDVKVGPVVPGTKGRATLQRGD